jgi:hypothetical protein
VAEEWALGHLGLAVRASVRWLGSLDIDDLAAWSPERDSWELGLRILAGPEGGPGEESFDVMVCSIGWLAERLRRDAVVDGRHRLFVERFDWPVLRANIERRVRECEGPTWTDVAEKLARLGYWEFEDYRP